MDAAGSVPGQLPEGQGDGDFYPQTTEIDKRKKISPIGIISDYTKIQKYGIFAFKNSRNRPDGDTLRTSLVLPDIGARKALQDGRTGTKKRRKEATEHT
jgi:hypothetical protein